MGATLFFYEIVRLFLEGYLELIVSSWLNFFTPDRGSTSSVFGYIFAILILCICWGFLPLISILMLLPRHSNKIEDPIWKKRFGALYAEQKTKSAWTLAYNTVFIALRFFFLMFLLPYTGPVTFEILGILYLNLTSLIYIGSTWSLNRRLYNKIDFFDEYWICILSLHLVLFTDFVGDSAVAYGYGWLMISLMIINLIVKLIFIFMENFFRVKMVWHRYLEPYYLAYIYPHLKCIHKPIIVEE